MNRYQEKLLTRNAPIFFGLTILFVIGFATLTYENQKYVTKQEYCDMIRLSLKPKYLPRNQIKLCYEELNRDYKKVNK